MIIKPDIFTNSAIKSLQTTRVGGVSHKPYNSMNLGIFSEDKCAQKNLDLLTKSRGLPHVPIFMEQIHSNEVVEYTEVPSRHGEIKADGCFTKKNNTICAVLTADCLPVLIADKNATTVAAIHCGWRGLYSDIIKNCLDKLCVNPQDLLCWLGPCISYKPYQVDEAFRQRFVVKNPQLAHCFYRNKKGGWHADLKKIAICQLESQGVQSILQSPYCTYDNQGLFYSYRRDKETGRMASLIWLQN